MRRLRRDAQDVTITPEIIDKLLDQIDFIVELDLTGGEPFLHPEIIEYLFDGIIKRDIFLFGAGSVTNGTICDQRVADAFSKLAKNVNEKVRSAKKDNPAIPDKGLVWLDSDRPDRCISPC